MSFASITVSCRCLDHTLALAVVMAVAGLAAGWIGRPVRIRPVFADTGAGGCDQAGGGGNVSSSTSCSFALGAFETNLLFAGSAASSRLCCSSVVDLVGLSSGTSAFSSDTVRLRREFCVTEAARVAGAGFCFSSWPAFALRVRALEICVIFLGDRGAWAAGTFARVCLVGRAAEAGFDVVDVDLRASGSWLASSFFVDRVLVTLFG